MSVKANWHLEDLDLPESDPVAEIAQLTAAPAPVLDLSESNDSLHSELVAAQFQASVAREASLAFMLYQECDLKWTVQAEGGGHRNPCRTCPLFCHDSSNPDSMLCNLGIQQEDLLDAFEEARRAEGLDGDMLRLMEGRFDAAHELAEAVL